MLFVLRCRMLLFAVRRRRAHRCFRLGIWPPDQVDQRKPNQGKLGGSSGGFVGTRGAFLLEFPPACVCLGVLLAGCTSVRRSGGASKGRRCCSSRWTARAGRESPKPYGRWGVRPPPPNPSLWVGGVRPPPPGLSVCLVVSIFLVTVFFARCWGWVDPIPSQALPLSSLVDSCLCSRSRHRLPEFLGRYDFVGGPYARAGAEATVGGTATGPLGTSVGRDWRPERPCPLPGSRQNSRHQNGGFSLRARSRMLLAVRLLRPLWDRCQAPPSAAPAL